MRTGPIAGLKFTTTDDFAAAVRGCFYRPIKQQITLRIDLDFLEWFKAQGGKYQTHINTALREYVQERRGLPHKNITVQSWHPTKPIS